MNVRRALAAWCAAGLMATAAAPALALALVLYESPGAAPFDYYVLALSWSPAFCASHPADRAECGLRRGFTVHGLWPQYAGGGGPEHCEGADALDRETVERVKAAMPDERLIHHEWVVHGTCSGLSPHDYFRTLIQAIGHLAIPPQFDGAAARTMTASQIVAAFAKANPSLTARSIALRCRASELEEVRICLSRDLHPQPCGPDVRTRCRSGALTIGAAH